MASILGASAVLLFVLLGAHWLGLRPLPASAIVPIVLLAAFLTAGVLQLVPMPASGWRALPGRETALSALQLVGAANDARPLSLDAEATRRALALLLLPAAVMIAVVGANRREIFLFVATVILCALVSAIIGALQLGLGYPSWLTYYDGANSGAASACSPTSITMRCCCSPQSSSSALPFASTPRSRDTVRIGAGFTRHGCCFRYSLVVIFATGSRAALLLLVLAVPVSVIVGLGRTSVKLLIVSLIAVALVVFALSEITPAGTNVPVGQSFIFSQDTRYAILPICFTR